MNNNLGIRKKLSEYCEQIKTDNALKTRRNFKQ